MGQILSYYQSIKLLSLLLLSIKSYIIILVIEQIDYWEFYLMSRNLDIDLILHVSNLWILQKSGPPMSLLDHNSLAIFCNAFIEACLDLRKVTPCSIEATIRKESQNVLDEMSKAIQERDKSVHSRQWYFILYSIYDYIYNSFMYNYYIINRSIDSLPYRFITL